MRGPEEIDNTIIPSNKIRIIKDNEKNPRPYPRKDMDIPDSNNHDRISIWNEYMDRREIDKKDIETTHYKELLEKSYVL